MKKFTIISVLFLSSCFNPQKAVKKAIQNDPESVAGIVREAFPCDVMRIDTVYDWHDTTLYEIIHDSIIAGHEIWFDTIYKERIKIVTITKIVEDSAKLMEIKAQIKPCPPCETIQLKKQTPGYLLFLLISSLIVNFVQAKRKKKNGNLS